MSNFAFLDGTWVSAAKVAQKAEQIVYQDSAEALQYLRKFGEMVAKNVVIHEEITLLEHATQYDRLKELDGRGILPKEIKNHFHSIRMTGNDAVHEDIGTIGQTMAILESAYFISVWAYRNYSDTSFKPQKFDIPQKTPNKEVLDDIKDSKNNIEEIKTNKKSPKETTPLITHQVKAPKSNRKPGDLNPKNQELKVITNVHSQSKPEQYIWIVICKNCSKEYGVNGCDFHIRKCPNCQGGKKGEPDKLWRHLNESNQENGEQKNHVKTVEPNGQLTLHEAMRKLLSEVESRTMKASQLADQIYNEGLYLKKAGDKALFNQVLSRARKYTKLFEILPGKYIKLVD